MFTPARLIVLSILTLILIIASWSKLRFLDETQDQPQRWRVEDYPSVENATSHGAVSGIR